MTPKVKYKIVAPEIIGNYPLQKATPGSAGVDLPAAIPEAITLQPNEVKLIPTGLKIWVEDPAYVGLIHPRSGAGHKLGLVLGNLTGVIDSDYQGQLMVSLWNRSTEPRVIEPLQRIAQYVVTPVASPEYVLDDSDWTTSQRADGGFGSSGQGAAKK